MVKFSQQFTFATTIALIILGAIDLPKTQAASLYLGLSKYVENIQIDNNSNLEKIASSPQLITRQDNTQEDIQFSNAQEINNNIGDRYQGLIAENEGVMNMLLARKLLLSEGGTYNQTVSQDELDKTKELVQESLAIALQNIPTQKEANSYIEEHYQGLIESQEGRMNMLLARKLLLADGGYSSINLENSEQIVSFLNLNPAVLSIEDRLNKRSTFNSFPPHILVLIGILLIIWIVRTFSYVSKLIIEDEDGFVEKIREKFGRPRLDKKIAFKHSQLFLELTNFSNRLDRFDNEKLSSEEFNLLLSIQKAAKQRLKQYRKLDDKVQLLKTALETQRSFLRIEQIESRYCSFYQQEFYDFIANSLSQELDNVQFQNSVKRKLAEIVPLLNTEEGRDALRSYLKEIEIISKRELGLKLLYLFKEHQLKDFTILKKVSEIISEFKDKDLLNSQNLVSSVINDYEVFEKLIPIIGISESENSPETYANILQYTALIYKHEKSYQQFQSILETLKKWQKPYKTVTIIRKEYKASEYRLPKEFYQEIPGLNIYKKYEKFLENSQQF
ncbi:MAG: hypothetical protein AB4206_06200 [Xenococcaceae cyanobacterium]